MILNSIPVSLVDPKSEIEQANRVGPDDAALRQAAQDFEATYIAQMLTFSGLDKALTAGGGDDMSAFTSFYIQSFAENIAENGGFGLADSFYDQMKLMSGGTLDIFEDTENVDFGKL